MKLSIITPYYNTFDYIEELRKSLEPQLKKSVEWIIVDDGSGERRLDSYKARVVHLAENSGNASLPRNLGLFYANGDYIAFIDSDDNVTPDYVEKILEKIKEGFDYCYISWKGTDDSVVIIEDKPPGWNCSVWSRVYKREKINNIKFDKSINIGEDLNFLMRLPSGTTTSIKEPIYIYTKGRKDSLTHQFSYGIIDSTK